MRFRIARSARKHKISSRRIRESMEGAELVEIRGDFALYIGTDLSGLQLELGVVADDRNEDQFVVIHAMPYEWRKR